ncbi:HK-domain-containing protein, partial [Violaceomyces palustris]
ELLPPGVDYYQSLEDSLKGGHVGLVQIREKDADSGSFYEIAKKSLEICDKYNVPMLINDNLTIALSLPNRVGLHIGQEDISVRVARQLLGPDRLLGISVHTVEQAQAARVEGADYAGVGPTWGTLSKAGITEDKVLGPRGVREVVQNLGPIRTDDKGKRIPCVLIGGINQRTALRSLFGATSETNAPDGIAVISAIVARRDPDVAARELGEIVSCFKSGLGHSIERFSSREEVGGDEPKQRGIKAAFGKSARKAEDHLEEALAILTHHRESEMGPPLIQTITSHVSSTMSANVALAFSSSPIMSHESQEAEELSKAVRALVLNIGTIGDASRAGMRIAGAAANRGKKPVVLDPVGVGATAFRKNVVSEILNHTQVTLLKGNAAELGAIAGSDEVESRGVDSGSGKLSDPVGLVKGLARRERCLVLLSGKVDYLTDGERVLSSENGHPLLARITGSGCALGVTVAAALAATCNYAKASSSSSDEQGLDNLMVSCGTSDLLSGALLGLLTMTIASEMAAERDDVKGPGSFIPALIDEIARISPQDIRKRAKIQVVT